MPRKLSSLGRKQNRFHFWRPAKSGGRAGRGFVAKEGGGSEQGSCKTQNYLFTVVYQMKGGGTFYLSNVFHFFSGKNINISVNRPGFKA